MSFKELLDTWASRRPVPATDREYAVRLSLEDAARLHALAELYPGMSVERIITDLLGRALDEVVEAMPYVQGDDVIREDDQGDPVYADAGPTARFVELSRRHRERLRQEDG